jgi:hypothetical protein
MMNRVTVYVPTEGSPLALLVDSRSGVVGRRVEADDPDSEILVYFESNRLRVADMVTFADRVACAAARLVDEEETVARARVPSHDVQAVGEFYPKFGWVEVSGAAGLVALSRWLGFEFGEPGHPDRLGDELLIHGGRR